jgi:glycosyltransferase domain-containing protein
VADSSDPAEREANRSVVDSTHGKLDVRLHEFGPDASISLKAAQAMATVESEFVALCADKDFVSPVGIDKCAAYLQTNQDYATAQGRTVLAANVEPSSLNQETGMVVWRGDDFSIDSDEPQARLSLHLRDYHATFYAVHRRRALLHNMQLSASETRDWRFGELLPSCLSIIQGKTRVLDVVHLVRHFRPDISSKKTPPRFSDWLAAGEFPKSYGRFRSCLVRELTGADARGEEQAERLVDDAFRAYVDKGFDIGGRSNGNRFTVNGAMRALGRAWYRVQVLPDAARVAVLDRRLPAILSSPAVAYKALQRERRLRTRVDAIPIGTLLDRGAPHRADFLPIYESIVRYPDGVPYVASVSAAARM